ncbi:phosphoribosylformylglycinamidine synthase subunit PurS [Gryllotalpicola reticulitermitis]|uniref:Phosphoribosylformylglycinamidine synthase subunit PurS n=1 Tax=Gryllotalpicola reticulitermitis TaxID=1184153 RepID=A0ABV8Q814_9MICO
MPTIVVEVMPKAELLDPQGKAIAGALARTGRGDFQVRQGKRFELTAPGDEISQDLLDHVREIAADVLSNSVIEDVVAVRVVSDAEHHAHTGA